MKLFSLLLLFSLAHFSRAASCKIDFIFLLDTNFNALTDTENLENIPTFDSGDKDVTLDFKIELDDSKVKDNCKAVLHSVEELRLFKQHFDCDTHKNLEGFFRIECEGDDMRLIV